MSKTIYIRGGAASNTAIKVMTSHFIGYGYEVVRSRPISGGYSTVCWETSDRYATNVSLNKFVNSTNKYGAFFAFDTLKVRHPEVFGATQLFEGGKFSFPLLARKVHHKGGTDIVVCKTMKEALAAKPSADFFSVFVPTKTEYRLWVFEGTLLAVYEKVYKGEGEYAGFMRNRKFGFSFQKRDELVEDAALGTMGANAVLSLGMDFGAVDVILGKDGKYYCLEVNSMPAIDSTERSSGIRLAKSIVGYIEKHAK